MRPDTGLDSKARIVHARRLARQRQRDEVRPAATDRRQRRAGGSEALRSPTTVV